MDSDDGHRAEGAAEQKAEENKRFQTAATRLVVLFRRRHLLDVGSGAADRQADREVHLQEERR